jgi:hypothetical protein
MNTALGSDNVSPYFLKNGGESIHKSLFLLFSICFRHGLVPTSFRHGHVVTLYKGEGEVSDPNNYRPITITSVIARLYERVHVKSLLAAMLHAGIPSPDQFGFTMKRSCHDAIYRLLTVIADTIDSGSGDDRFVPAVFVDISKAYDKVWIEGLLYKLHNIGITGNLYYMIRSLLLNRTIQVVGIDGKLSILHTLTAGVPQGSILAPFLFLIYIHDMLSDDDVKAICMSLFADDIAMLPLTPGDDGLAPLQRALTAMTRYASKWKITFSSKKTNTVYFHPDCPGKWTEPSKQLKLGGFNITTATQYTYLGVVLDDMLTFTAHACNVIKQVSCTSQMISRLVRRDAYPSFPVIQTLVKCILVPQLTYGFSFFSVQDKPVSTGKVQGNNPSSRGNLYKRMKNAILRPLLCSLGLPHNTCHASAFIESRLLDVNSLFSLCAARLVHRWLNMKPISGNATAALFFQQLSSPPHPSLSFHPFNVLLSAICHIPAFNFDPDDIHKFSSIDRKSLRLIVWNQQYRSWYDNPPFYHNKVQPFPSLTHWYPRVLEKSQTNKVPHYLHYDHPRTASHRARLRFGRALLCYDLHRFKYKDVGSPKCSHCSLNENETVTHVITRCTAYDRERSKCMRVLDIVMPPRSQWTMFRFANGAGPAVAPEVFVDAHYNKYLKRVLYVTGKYIDNIQQTRKF